jgi:glyoxylase-like metal-dependent hydrolase (beta-lactamase superfamily II)
MLFDTGLGEGKGVLMGSLASAQISPTQITDVFITHSHGDHVGGLTTAAGGLAFPNAVIHMSKLEWDFFSAQKSSQAVAAIIKPKVQPFEPGKTVAPGVTAIALYGHTPGHVGYEIASGADKLLDIGDLVHSSIISLKEPEWRIGFDTDGKAGTAIRQATLTRLASDHERVFSPHFPYPGIGHIEKSGNAFAWAPGFGK